MGKQGQDSSSGKTELQMLESLTKMHNTVKWMEFGIEWFFIARPGRGRIWNDRGVKTN